MAREPVYFLKSPSGPGMCISIELFFINIIKLITNGSVRFFCCYVLICMKFTLKKKFFNIQRNAACASTLNMYCAYWADKLFWWHVISHDLMHLVIFYSLATSPKRVHYKHPDLFRKLNKHLLVELKMCENTFIGGVVIFGHFVPDSAFATHAMLFVMVILP